MIHNAQRFSAEAVQNGIRRQVALARASEELSSGAG
jgi:hypothetical protein